MITGFRISSLTFILLVFSDYSILNIIIIANCALKLYPTVTSWRLKSRFCASYIYKVKWRGAKPRYSDIIVCWNTGFKTLSMLIQQDAIIYLGCVTKSQWRVFLQHIHTKALRPMIRTLFANPETRVYITLCICITLYLSTRWIIS